MSWPCVWNCWMAAVSMPGTLPNCRSDVRGGLEELHVGGSVERNVALEAPSRLQAVRFGDGSHRARPLDGVAVWVLRVDRRSERVLHPHDVVTGAQPPIACGVERVEVVHR